MVSNGLPKVDLAAAIFIVCAYQAFFVKTITLSMFLQFLGHCGWPSHIELSIQNCIQETNGQWYYAESASYLI